VRGAEVVNPLRVVLAVTPIVLAVGTGGASAAPRMDASPALAAEKSASAMVASRNVVTLKLDGAAYYWREQSKSVPVAGVAPPSVPDSTVPHGDLAVAAANDASGQPDKETYLRLDTGQLVGGTPTTVRLVVPLDTSTGATQAYDTTAPPSLTVCGVAGAFTDTTGAVSFEDKPKDDCTVKTTGTFDAAHTTWTFDITSIVNRWVTVGLNSGLAILPSDPASTIPFQYVFGPRSRIHATAQISSLPAQLDQQPPTSLSSASAAPPATGAVPLSPPQPATASAPSGPAPSPVVAAPPVSAPSAAPVAFSSRVEWRLPVLGLLGTLGLLAFCSVVAGARRRNAPRII
jgi:hypothetical protein